MAVLHPLYQEIFDDRTGRHFSVTRVRVSGDGDTIQLPTGILNSTGQVTIVPVNIADTAATVATLTQVATDNTTATIGGTTITITGGTADSQQLVFAVHHGSAAGLGV